MLTVQNVADHWRLSPASVRARIYGKALKACRMGREFRIAWPDVWANEAGPLPRDGNQERYMVPLLTQRQLASAISVSTRTVERWIIAGLPTRNVGKNVRISTHDAQVWLAHRFGLDSNPFFKSSPGRDQDGRFASTVSDAPSI